MTPLKYAKKSLYSFVTLYFFLFVLYILSLSGFSLIWANIPTNNLSTLWSMPLEVSMNLQFQLYARFRPTVTNKIIFLNKNYLVKTFNVHLFVCLPFVWIFRVRSKSDLFPTNITPLVWMYSPFHRNSNICSAMSKLLSSTTEYITMNTFGLYVEHRVSIWN